MQTLASWGIAVLLLLLRATCRVSIHNDPRDGLRAESRPYAFSILHAHQVAAAINREPGTAAMVSRSPDGELLMRGFRAIGIKTIRGSSSRKGDEKGGRMALTELVAHVKSGLPAYIAVDGPRGPRNHVRKGIAVLSKQSGAAVLNVAVIPTRRLILRNAWDRLQIPMPFCRIDAYFAAPLWPIESESAEAFRYRIERSLNDLELVNDPDEANAERR